MSTSENFSVSIESHYAKQTDGFVYYYWRLVGSDTWNVQKTAMKEVPTTEMVMNIRNKVAKELANQVAPEGGKDNE